VPSTVIPDHRCCHRSMPGRMDIIAGAWTAPAARRAVKDCARPSSTRQNYSNGVTALGLARYAFATRYVYEVRLLVETPGCPVTRDGSPQAPGRGIVPTVPWPHP